MRAARRLLASVRPRQFLEAGNPTGLTGLFTHPAPRSTLLYLYNITLDRLKELPEHSIYRQSTEALTKHRYQIVKSFEPAGYAEWSKRAAEQVKKYQEIYGDPEVTPLPMVRHDNAVFVAVPQDSGKDEREVNWDGEEITAGTLEGSRSGEERAYQKELFKPKRRINPKAAQWEPEPSLEASQYVAIFFCGHAPVLLQRRPR